MAIISFYHLTHTDLSKALPALAAKIQQQGEKALLKAGTAERLAQLDMALWTFRQNSFLPHGVYRHNDNAWNAAQPLLLSLEDTTVNTPAFLMLVDGVTSPLVTDMQRVLVLFDGHDPDAVATARLQWKGWGGQKMHALTYYQQQEDGGWQKR